ncbi:MAG: hypothetical protein ACHQ4H_02070 [Ktedonobacterales bacterium]
MLVQRLTNWLTNLVTRIAARLRGIAPLAAGEGHASNRGGDTSLAASTQQSAASWLDDAHRLRPPRALLTTADQTRSARPVVPPPAPRKPAPADRTPTPSRPVSPANPPQEPVRPSPVAPQQPVIAAMSFGADPIAGDVQARRRLMSLKYLVRIGLYNEGFAAENVPEQYQRSLGIDLDAE